MSDRLEGKPVSLWVATAAPTAYPMLDTDVEVDVAVVGGGIAGLTAALALKRAGHTVAVLESARIGSGVTGSTTGKVTSLHRLVYADLAESHDPGTARAYGQANQDAIEHVARVVAQEGIDCGFRRVANYTYALTDASLARVRAEASLAAGFGLPSAFTDEVPLPFAVKGAVRFDEQAQLHALRYVQGLARAVDGGGSFVFERSPARALREGSPSVVETWNGSLRAREVIVATNVPFGDGGRFGQRCYPHRSYLVAAPTSAPDPGATFISVDDPLRSIMTATVDGTRYVLAGGEGHRASAGGGTVERYRRLADFARDSLHAGEIAFRWSTQDSMPVDGLPYAGPISPTARHIHVITGLRKWGLTNGTAAALMLTGTVTGTAGAWASLFDTNRPGPPPGAAEAAGTADAGSDSAGSGATAQDGLARLEALAPGEGTVVAQQDGDTAVYADEDGRFLAVSATCTHQGCTVEFNPVEATWDCPCHGSRFATDGSVIQGPAAENLASRPAPSPPSGSHGPAAAGRTP
ncbi:FAD-dependent oxidoreductase [Arthrobacter ginkgonis]|uniref:FAD-dependent oxidoreductase n=1 Tax=Arthrobacter ginkgonis TaxID=1630594 RepID=A0ABP7BTW2_9MICC